MEGLGPLSETESIGFFQSLLSKPRLLARTDSNSSPYRPMRRALVPVEDSATITSWTSSLRQSLINQLSRDIPSLSWTAFLPLRILSRPYHWSDEPSESDHYLLICVAPGTTGWKQATRAARDCRAVLREHGVTSMETLVTELDMVLAAGPASPGEPKPVPARADSDASLVEESASEASAPVELQDVFDLRFRDIVMDSSVLAAVNEALLQFLPLPGQKIHPEDATDLARNLPAGSLTGFLRLEDGSGCLSGTVYALASRHIAVQDLYDHHTDFNRTSSSSQQHPGSVLDIKIHTGAAAAIDRQQVRLHHAQLDLADWIHRLTKSLFKNGSQDAENDRGIALLELMEECRSRYVGEALKGIAALGMHGESSTRTRQVGHVAFAARHGIDTEGFWKDWALIALPSVPHPAQPGLFFTNKVYAGNWVERVNKRRQQMLLSGRLPDGHTFGTPDATDDANFVNVQAPHPPLLTRSNTRIRPVVKRGPVTGLTVGLLSPIEAVVRRPLPGVDVVAWAWPVLSCVLEPDYELSNRTFSASGDSGSLVFDTDGIAVGMLDAGLGANEKPRRTFQHYQAAQAGSSAAAAPTNPTAPPSQGDGLSLPDQSAVPHGFMRWDATSPESGQTERIDITLITPIDAVFASIKNVTGKTPRMV